VAADEDDLLRFAEQVTRRHRENLCNDGPVEQAARALRALHRIHAVAPLSPVANTFIDLAGFGEAPVHFASGDDLYLLLSETADALGWPGHKAHAWAELQHSYAVADQRRIDEERGDGRLGWECMRDYIDLDLDLVVDDPEAKPDAGGGRWSHSGDWLICNNRLPLLLSSSPWGVEFMNNTMPAFGHAMRRFLGDALKSIPTYDGEGRPTGGNAHTDLFRTDLSEEEALRMARRGVVLDEES
jgi:hypothetical protein